MTQITSRQHKTELKEAFLKQFDVFSQKQNGYAYLQRIRQEALSSFKEQGFPGNKNEEYKYTHITRALEKNFDLSDIEKAYRAHPGVQEQMSKLLMAETEANLLVFVNGQFSKELSKIVSPQQELIVQPFSEAYEENSALIEQHWGRYADHKSDAFVALNTAFAHEGLFIRVPKGKVVEAPILVYFISDTTQDKGIFQSRNLYLVEENSQVNLAESFHTIGENPGYQNVVSEIVVDQNAVVNYHKIEIEGSKTYHTGTTQVVQTAQSLFNAITVSLSGAMIRNNLNVVLDAEGCEAHMFGLYMLDQDTHVDNHTMVDHRLPNSFSNESYKGIMDDRSRGVFNGKIYVRPGAQKTNAFQSNMNILLTDDASVDTKPQLEIWADDVKCSHGATTGQINEDQLFYLRTRGLSEEQARAILLKAFASDVIQNIKIEPVREQLEHIITARLEKEF